jgi:hypothetical protein
MAEPLRISAAEVVRREQTGERVVLLDSRTHQHWSESPVKLPGALRFPLNAIDVHFAELPQGATAVAYCT